jgi:HTH-type transcriptional regulator/antitoxin HigA
MAATLQNPKLKGYVRLIDRFPLKTIENDREHEAAVEVITGLMGTKLDKGEGDYLSALIALVNVYEDQNHVHGEDLTPREALKAIMEFNHLTQADIGRIIGSESAVSMFLKGHRELSRHQIKALVERFKVDASLFL